MLAASDGKTVRLEPCKREQPDSSGTASGEEPGEMRAKDPILEEGDSEKVEDSDDDDNDDDDDDDDEEEEEEENDDDNDDDDDDDDNDDDFLFEVRGIMVIKNTTT